MMSCNDASLRLLMESDETNPAFVAASTHVQDCQVCQARLAEMATVTVGWWNEARSTWRADSLPRSDDWIQTDSVIARVGSSRDQEKRRDHAESEMDAEQMLHGVLEPGSHPEMLGRLGRYEIERIVGHGGMGVVLKAYDTELHRVVAIKILAPAIAMHATARRRFAREAQAAAAVVHPNVIPIYDVATDRNPPYLVMQYIAGESLHSRVESQGPMTVAEALRVAQQTAAGLAEAHAQGLVHRDVKPANILLEPGVQRIVLSDFGLARTADDASLTRTGMIAGTPHYMSPEQSQGEPVDGRSDLFGLGSVMYFMLTGRPPFRANSAMAVLQRICNEPHVPLRQVNPDVPYEVSRVVDRLLAKDPNRRFESADEAEQTLHRLLSQLQSGRLSLQTPLNERLRTLVSSRRASQIVAGLVVGLATVCAILGFRSWLPNETTTPSQSVTKTVMTVEQLREIQYELRDARTQQQTWDRQFDQTLGIARDLASQASPAVPVSSDPFDQRVQQLREQLKTLDLDRDSNPLGRFP